MVEEHKQTIGTMRVHCGNCDLIDNYPDDTQKTGNFTCKHCGETKFAGYSEYVDKDSQIAHYKNKQYADWLEDRLSQVQYSINKFEEEWDSSWNSNDTETRNFEEPTDWSKLDGFETK